MDGNNRNRFHPVRRNRAPREIIAQVREMIAGGDLKTGERLPSERDLAKSFGVGRSTLREAVRVLESLGLVEVRPGEGTYLTAHNGARTQNESPRAFFGMWITRLHLFELRTVLEPGLAGLAARRVTSDQLAKMRGTLEAQAARVQGGEAGTDEDVAFHELIAEATGNPALVQLMKNIADLLQETRDASLQLDGRPARSVRENRAVLAAIEARSPALAASRMRAHIRSLELVLFAGAREPPETLQTCHTEGKSHS